jgi:hypothetical protein
MVQMQGALGSLTFKSDEKPYQVTVMYMLKGRELLVAEMRCDDKATEFDSKQLVDLSKCSLMTEILLEEQAPALLWPTGPRSRVWGERFFWAENMNLTMFHIRRHLTLSFLTSIPFTRGEKP